MVDKFFETFRSNVKYLNFFLKLLNQPILCDDPPRNLFRRVLQMWPLWFNSLMVVFYGSLILVERARLEISSKQLWCFMTVVQLVAKLINRLVNGKTFRELLDWCQGEYGKREKQQRAYQEIVDQVFEQMTKYTTMFIKYDRD